MVTKKIVVTQSPKLPPVSEEIIAQSIKKIADGFEKIANSGLTRRAIFLLLADASGESRSTCQRVYEALGELKRLYLK